MVKKVQSQSTKQKKTSKGVEVKTTKETKVQEVQKKPKDPVWDEEVKKRMKECPLMALEKSDIKLYFPVSVVSKITTMCSMCGPVEWSGFILYKEKGKDLEAVDIFPSDIGTYGFTSCSLDMDFMGYMEKKGYMDDTSIYTGLIHSHNNMEAYFSKTDEDTIHKEALQNDNFLTVVVNNRGNYVARVTKHMYKVFVGTISHKSKWFSQDSSGVNQVNRAEESIVQYNITCVKYGIDDIIERYNEIRKRSNETYSKKCFDLLGFPMINPDTSSDDAKIQPSSNINKPYYDHVRGTLEDIVNSCMIKISNGEELDSEELRLISTEDYKKDFYKKCVSTLNSIFVSTFHIECKSVEKAIEYLYDSVINKGGLDYIEVLSEDEILAIIYVSYKFMSVIDYRDFSSSLLDLYYQTR